MRIGPRLLLLLTLPISALLVISGLLALNDIERVRELRAYDAQTHEIDDLIDLQTALQEERHLLIDPSAPTVLVEPVDAGLGSAIATALDMGMVFDVAQVLPEARELRDNGQLGDAAIVYTSVIDELGQVIESRLGSAPLGEPARTADAIVQLLAGREALLQEDVEFFLGGANPTALVDSREIGLIALSEFRANASVEGVDSLQELTESSAWELLDLDRFDSAADVDDRDQRRAASDVRRLSLIDLTTQEMGRAQTFIGELTQDETSRLLSLAGIIAAVLLIALSGSILLARSIIGPLSTLSKHARALSEGEVSATHDLARDEIAEVSNSFDSVSKTIDHLFGDIDKIAEALHLGDYSERIDTESLQGDWRRLASTMNSTLDTGEAHHRATSDELARRMVMAEISNTAILAEDGATITSQILHQLPKALKGSHAHLYQHPTGPPIVDLGVALEPVISALEVPTMSGHAGEIQIGESTGVAALIEFPEGPPAVLALLFGDTKPTQVEPLISLVETSGRILAQGHRRQLAETQSTHNLEHDLTTGLANIAHLQRWFSDTATPRAGWMALGVTPQHLTDLDGSFGRDAHDSALRAIGLELEALVDEVATTHGADTRLVRVGEPEFVAVVPADHGEALANAFASHFMSPVPVGETTLSVDATIGFAEIDPSDDDLTEALANVAIAVRRGHHRTTEIVPFEARYREDARRRTQLTQWLEHAIENRDLTIHFQPIVNSYSTVVEGYECLIRGSLDGTPVSPAEFIPLAEETGMIVAIGSFALREACAALPFLPGDNPYVAVNLSPFELRDPELRQRIDTVLTDAKVNRSRIVLEVTEGAETSSTDAEILRELRELGVKIAIDDFGSGHANLAYLTTLPAQIVKLDRALITPMVDDPGAAAVVKKAIEMAHDLGMSVVGEGVETNDELNALRLMKCDRIQGWLTGRPAPLSDFIEIALQPPSTQIERPNSSSKIVGR